MSPTSNPAEAALERRVAEALGARAALTTVEPAALGERLARVHAAAGDSASVTGPAAPAPVVELVGDEDDDGDALSGRRRSRLVVAAVASAAAAAVIVAAVLSLADHGGSAPVPAATAQPSPSSSSSPTLSSGEGGWWSGFSGLDHEQWPSEREGVAAMGPGIVADSVRLLVQLGAVTYWAGFTPDGVLCSKAAGPGVDQGVVCVVDPATGRGSLTHPVEVSDGSVAPQVWVVPPGTPAAETAPLTEKGLVEWTPGVWAEASAVTPPLDRYARFRDAPTGADEVPASSAIVVRDPIVPGSMRHLYDGQEGTFYAAYLALGKVCLFWNAPSGHQSAGWCQTPEQLAGAGLAGVSEDDRTSATAWLVPDDLDTSGWAALGRVQLARNLWFESQPVPAAELLTPRPQPSASLLEQHHAELLPAQTGTLVPDEAGVDLFIAK